MIYIPFIIGGIGFVFWGLKGALIGAAIGGVISGFWYLFAKQTAEFNASKQEHKTSSQTSTGNNISPALLMKFRILALIASVMKADGVILKSEVDSIKPFLLKHYGVEGGREALQILKHLLDTSIDTRQVAKELKNTLNYSSRLEVLHMLLTLAYADGQFDPTEKLLIRVIAIDLAIGRDDLNAMFALFMPKTNSSWAYAALGITSEASDDEVKRAYRKMAMLYHPDRVVENEDLKRSATEKFREIQTAYECIKKERNMN